MRVCVCVCVCVCVGEHAHAHACVHVQVITLDTIKLPWTDLNCLKIIFRFFFFFFEQYLTFTVRPFQCQVSAVAGPLYN